MVGGGYYTFNILGSCKNKAISEHNEKWITMKLLDSSSPERVSSERRMSVCTALMPWSSSVTQQVDEDKFGRAN